MTNGIPNVTSNAKEFLDQANNCILAQNITEATALFEQAITIDGIKFLPAFKNVADLLLHNDCISEAQTAYEKIVNKFPNRIEGYLGLAQIAEKDRNWQLALTKWENIINKFPEQVNGWNGKANCLLQLQRWDEATKVSEDIIEKFPDKIHGYHRLANIATKQRNWQLSLLRWQQVHEKFPDDFWGIYGQGDALLQLGQLEEAENIYQQVITKFPNRVEGQAGLTKVANQRQNINTTNLSKIANQNTDNTKKDDLLVWNNQVNQLLKLNQLESAEKLAQEMIEKFPDKINGYHRLANVADKQRDWQLSLFRWQQVHEKFPNDFWGICGQANTLLNLNRLAEAEKFYQLAIEKFPGRIEGYEGIARIAEKNQDWQLALNIWQDITIKFPESINGWNSQANSLLQLQRWDEATKISEEMIEKFPDKINGYHRLANIADKQRDWQLSLLRWQQVHEKFPEDLWGICGQANAYLQLNNWEVSEEYYQEVMAKFPHQHDGLEGLTKVARISGKLELALEYAEKLKEKFPQLQSGYWETEQILIEMGRFQEATQAFLSRPVQTNLPPKKVKPDNFPDDLILPPLRGIGNDYTFIEEKLAQFIESGQPYHLPVSIIIPVYNRKEILGKTLAALTHQTYPQNLIEVVVVDDGSSDGVEEVIRKYENYLELIYTRQADRGYRLCAARNLGMRTARHNYFIIIDSDILPYPNLVEDYMKYFHVSDQAILIGLRRYVCTDNLTDEQILEDINVPLNLPDIIPDKSISGRVTQTGQSYDWRLELYARTNYLKELQWNLGFAGGNVAYPKQAVIKAGEYDENFQHWGKEDNEIAYRFYKAGFYFIPVMSAMSLHQEPTGESYQVDRESGLTITDKLLIEKCPFPSVRKYEKGRVYEVPKVSIYIPAYNAEKYIKEAVDSVLNQTYTDLEVCICNDGSTDNTSQILEENYSNNPRVRWISQVNSGIAKASKVAVGMCKGMYIGHLDSDDLLKPHAVKMAVDYLDSNPEVGYVYSACEIIDQDGNFIRESRPNIDFSREALLTGMMITHFRMFRKRDYMKTIGFNQSIMNAVDYDLALKLSEVCHFHYIDSINYSYRFHGKNTSIEKRKIQETNHFQVINDALARLKLDNKWVAVQANITNPRGVKICKKSSLVEELLLENTEANFHRENEILIEEQLAYQLLQAGKLTEAIDYYNRALSLPGDKTGIYQGLAFAYRQLLLQDALSK
jgi:glycosyltransferase involved in cell wall biosynthesis/tetratricopeptide (TPR) repeat protein